MAGDTIHFFSNAAEDASGHYVGLWSRRSGAGPHSVILRYSPEGELIWHKDVNGMDLQSTFSKPVQNGGLVVLGNRRASPQLTEQVLVQLDVNGQAEWQTVLSAFKDDLLPLALFDLPDQGYIAVMGSYQTTSYALITRLDAQGAVMWQRQINHPSGLPFTTFRPPVLYHAHLLLASDLNHLWRIDLNGDTAALAPVVPLENFPVCNAPLIRLSDGNFLWMTSNEPTMSSFDFNVLDSNGVVLFKKYGGVFNYPGFGSMGITPLKEGGFATFEQGITFKEHIVRFRRFSAGAELLQEVVSPFPLTYDSSYLNLYSMTQVSDGGFVITGEIDSNKPFILKCDSTGKIYRYYFGGRALFDRDNDCFDNAGEPGLAGWKYGFGAAGAGSSYFGASGAQGRIALGLPDSGDYQVKLYTPNDYWEICPDDSLILFTASTDTFMHNFPAQARALCPFLEVDIGAAWLRRCFENNYFVRYCNTGTADAQNAYIRVTLDPAMQLVSAGLPALEEDDHTWRFPVGDIPIGQCGSFGLRVYLDCDATIPGQTHCVEAHIYPDSVCLSPGNWNGAEVDVEGGCYPDSIRFAIKNVGTATTSQLDYIVIEDNIIYFQGQFQLPPGDSLPIAVPANGSTWRLEAGQEPGSPANPMPSVTVEGCGQNTQGGISFGFVSQFGESDGDPFVSVDCRVNTGSFDPNDKQAFPAGYGSAHYIEPGQELEYLIRFQNTGTDTAFYVAIFDTLSPWLDPASVVPGASSHPYRFDLRGPGVLKFIFENILLPDSNANETASHGFVKFRVRQRDGVPLGTVIRNRAAIYFDFNAPVITHETWHTVGENFVVSRLKPLPAATTGWTVFPNPTHSGRELRLTGPEVISGVFEAYDCMGRLAARAPVSANRVALPDTGLPPGAYTFVIRLEHGWVLGSGKLMVH